MNVRPPRAVRQQFGGTVRAAAGTRETSASACAAEEVTAMRSVNGLKHVNGV